MKAGDLVFESQVKDEDEEYVFWGLFGIMREGFFMWIRMWALRAQLRKEM